MDLYCPVRGCGEPSEIDSLHDEAKGSGRTFADVRRDFAARGCLALTTCDAKHNTVEDERRDGTFGLTAAEASDVLFDLLGDNVDGIAAEMADLGF